MSAPNYPVTEFLQRNATQYNFVQESGSSVLQSPTFVEASDSSSALKLTCDLSGNTAILGTSTSASANLSLAPNSSGVGDVLIVRENPGTGVGFVQIGNPNGTSISIAGNTAANSQAVIQTNGTGTLQIGANGTSFDNLTLNADHSVTLAKAPGYAATFTSQSLGNIPNAAVVALTNPAAPGLYAVVLGSTDPAFGTYSAYCQGSLVGYFNGTTWNVGGAVAALTSSSGDFQIRPSINRQTGVYKDHLEVANSLGEDTTAASMICYMIPLTSSLTGLI